MLLLTAAFGLKSNPTSNADMIAAVKENIPEGWTLTAGENTFTVQRTDQIWVRIPAVLAVDPQDSTQSDDDYMRYLQTKGHAKQKQFFLMFRYEDVWPEGEGDKVRENNAKAKAELKTLPEKFNVTHLKAGSMYVGGTDEERERVRQFQARRTELLNSLKVPPTFSGTNYTFFVKDNFSRGEKAGTSAVNDEISEVFGIVANTVRSF